MIRRNMTGAAAIALAAAALCGAGINRSVNTKRDAGATPISSVCLVSLDAQLNRYGMKGSEPLLPEGEEWGRKLREMLTHAVTGAGWQLAGDLSDDSAAGNNEARETVLRVKQKYDTIAKQLYKKPGKVQKGRYTLGDEVALLPCAAHADSLLFVNGVGQIKTGGRKAFSYVIGGYAGPLLAQSEYSISISFVDARTGEVTALTRIGLLGGKVGKDPEKVLTARLVEEFNKMRPAPPKP